MSSLLSSVRSHVYWMSGVNSLTTGLKSSASSPLSIAARYARPLARSCSVSALHVRVRITIAGMMRAVVRCHG
jgi:hypothetical protein